MKLTPSRADMPRRLLLLAILTLAGCFPETEAPLAPLCPTASVAVNAGNPPVFNWGSCGVALLQVSASNNRSDIKWSIGTPDKLPDILSPVTYGEAPSNVTEAAPAIPLVSGAEYRMNLIVFVDDVASTIASVRFTQP